MLMHRQMCKSRSHYDGGGRSTFRGYNLLRQLYTSWGIAGTMIVSLALPNAMVHLFGAGQEIYLGEAGETLTRPVEGCDGDSQLAVFGKFNGSDPTEVDG
jgi:hypothetical protein